MTISDAVKKQRQDIKSDKMDMSFGEIMNMYKNDEIIISPEYQRAFRWDIQKQTDFIESILLGIPFPSIFVVGNEDGKWELIDGLQRVSTVLSFFGELKTPDKNNLKLSSGGLLPQLEDMSIDNLPTDLKLSIKRTPCRIEIIQRDSQFELRYELFKRLNTGGEGLERQEIRNCVFRGFTQYEYFTKLIETHSMNSDLHKIAYISQDQKDKMLYQELCLRFFALHNFINEYSEKSIQDFFDKVMKNQCENPDINLADTSFSVFQRICAYLSTTEENVFKLARLNFSTSMYDSIMITLADSQLFERIPIDGFLASLEVLKSSVEFRENSGSASSSPRNIKKKVEIAKQILIGDSNGENINR